MSEFGDLIKELREKKDFTQKMVVQKMLEDGVIISQAALSLWEKGDQLPAVTVSGLHKVSTLAKVLGADKNTLIEVIGNSKKVKVSRLFSKNLFFEETQNVIENYSTSNNYLEVWIMNYQDLVFGDEERMTWIDNLKTGVTYHILWFLDIISLGDFENSVGFLSSVAQEAMDESDGAKPTGKIICHGIDLSFLGNQFFSVDNNRGVKRSYDYLVNHFRADNNSVFQMEERVGPSIGNATNIVPGENIFFDYLINLGLSRTLIALTTRNNSFLKVISAGEQVNQAIANRNLTGSSEKKMEFFVWLSLEIREKVEEFLNDFLEVELQVR